MAHLVRPTSSAGGLTGQLLLSTVIISGRSVHISCSPSRCFFCSFSILANKAEKLHSEVRRPECDSPCKRPRSGGATSTVCAVRPPRPPRSRIGPWTGTAYSWRRRGSPTRGGRRNGWRVPLTSLTWHSSACQPSGTGCFSRGVGRRPLCPWIPAWCGRHRTCGARESLHSVPARGLPAPKSGRVSR